MGDGRKRKWGRGRGKGECGNLPQGLKEAKTSLPMQTISESITSTSVQYNASIYSLKVSFSHEMFDKIWLCPNYRYSMTCLNLPSSNCHPDIRHGPHCPAVKVDWFKHDAPNQFPTTDPTIRQLGSEFDRNDWTLQQQAFHSSWILKCVPKCPEPNTFVPKILKMFTKTWTTLICLLSLREHKHKLYARANSNPDFVSLGDVIIYSKRNI